MKKRILALLLAMLMVLPIVSCASDQTPSGNDTTNAQGNETADPSQTTPAETEPEYKPDLPEVKNDGEQLVILNRGPDASTYKEVCIYAEEPTGDLVNDSVYRRNKIIEEKYGIEIVSVVKDNVSDAIQISAQSQTDEYDIAFPQMRLISSLSTSGYLYNLHDLNYVDFEKPYWDSNFNEDLTIHGKLYAMVSDISVMNLIYTRGIIFNRDLAEKNNLEDPYTLVKNNEWTLDKMIEMAAAVSNDLNGDQVYDDLDQYGVLTESSNYVYFIASCGIDLIKQDADGNLTVGFNNEKSINIIEKWRALYTDQTHAIDYSDLGNTAGAATIGSKWLYGRQIFANGQILFLQNGASQFKELVEFEMKDEYGILPQPKYDSEQERYYHLPDESSTVLVIPSTNDDYDRIAILVEDLAYYSNQTVLPAYYENVIKIRQSKVPEVAEMLDIIKNSMIYHLGLVYSIDVASTIITAASSGNIASSFKGGEKRLNKLLTNLGQKLEELP